MQRKEKLLRLPTTSININHKKPYPCGRIKIELKNMKKTLATLCMALFAITMNVQRYIGGIKLMLCNSKNICNFAA
jgi:hypothetical protein